MITFLLGLLVGALSTAKIKSIDYQIVKSSKSGFTIFFNAFAYNYWYFFLLWLLGFVSLGFVLTYFMTFLKGFSVGTLCFLLLKTSGIPGLGDFSKIIFPEILILIPLFLYLAYLAASSAANQKLIYQNSANSYVNQLILITGGIALYAIIITTINNFIKI